MVVRKGRKSRKKRGSRTVGGGGVKKRRHSGHKGGKGLAGSHKHRWMSIIQKTPEHFGKRGFTRPSNLVESVETVNVSELDECADELVKEGLAREEKDRIVIDASDLGFNKVLGGGRVSRPLKVIASDFSASAKKKLEKVGGEAVSGRS